MTTAACCKASSAILERGKFYSGIWAKAVGVGADGMPPSFLLDPIAAGQAHGANSR